MSSYILFSRLPAECFKQVFCGFLFVFFCFFLAFHNFDGFYFRLHIKNKHVFRRINKANELKQYILKYM